MSLGRLFHGRVVTFFGGRISRLQRNIPAVYLYGRAVRQTDSYLLLTASGQTGIASTSADSESQFPKTSPAQRKQFVESFAKLPLSFEANTGQADKSVKFFSRVSGCATAWLPERAASPTPDPNDCIHFSDEKKIWRLSVNIKRFCLALFILGTLGVVCSTADAQEKEWTWMNGSSTEGSTCAQVGGGGSLCGRPSLFGILNVPAAGNVPGGRDSAVSWTDPGGNFWLFGGIGFSSGYDGLANDLWKYDPASGEWVWISGGDPASSDGEYGTLGVPGVLNVPGSRTEASGWTDLKGNLWVFGGSGYNSPSNVGYLNDLWEFRPSSGEWTWVSGAKSFVCATLDGYYLCGSPGAYGTLGAPAATNVPSGRASATTWIDSNGDFWLFGGITFSNIYPNGIYLNELWRFTPSTGEWTWMSGSPSSSLGQPGVYGTLGQPAAANVPGARYQASGWTDKNGNLWLFGGEGPDASGRYGWLNDLWEFTPSSREWTWMGGSKTVPASGAGQPGVYGTLGTSATGNFPGGRTGATTWVDANGNFWLFGGLGADSKGTSGYLNDIWQLNPTTQQWAWMGGSTTAGTCSKNGVNTYCGQSGVYGVQGTPAGGNSPGGRYKATGWTDTSGNVWLFGGFGADSSHAWGELNDLWVFRSSSTGLPTATPNFSPAPGVYSSAVSVSLSDPIPGASMYYTTDGTTPAATSTKYSNAITVSSSQTIKAIAVAPGYNPSAIASGTYTIQAATASTTSLAVTSGGATVTSVPLGSPVTLTATVQAGGAAVTTGQVNFCDAAAASCAGIHLLRTAQLTSAGTASMKFNPGIGSHSYKAVFLGTTHKAAPSSSGVSNLTVTGGKFATTTTITQQSNSAGYALTATVKGSVYEPGLTTPAGEVSFLDTTSGNAALGSAALAPGVSSLGWLVPQTLQTGSEPSAVAVGDFNMDGVPDVAVANFGSNTVAIFLGKGDGTFAAVAASPSTNAGPYDLAVGDFNGDGIPDLAVANFEDNSITILVGAGDGTFRMMPANVAVNYTPSAIAVADFNGDGKADLAVLGPNTILLGNGDGTFTPSPKSFGSASFPTAMAVGDFNGDGKMDIVVTDRLGGYEGEARIFLGNGDGSFTKAATPDGGFGPESVAVGDFNGDGKADLAIGDSGGVRILLGNGDGTFTGSSISLGPENLWGIFAGDFNGDGRLDLAVQDSDTNAATILIGQGDGTFVPAPGNAAPAAGNGPHSLGVGDFDGDGVQDLVAANYDNTGGNGPNQNTASVLLARPMETATATISAVSSSAAAGHTILASYSGDNNFSASVSSPTVVGQPLGKPSITPGGIVAVDSTVNTIQPGEWVSIFGTNLAGSTVIWNGNFPTLLGGTSVTINGKAAFLSFVSSTQINLQAPDDAATGSVPVVVTTAGGTATSTVTLAQFAPSFLLLDSKHVAGIIVRSNGSGAYGGGAYDILGPTGNSLGYATVAAKAGDTVELFALGLGSTDPAEEAGRAFSGTAPTTSAVDLLINNVSATPAFAGLSGAGLYQINLTIPAGLGTGDLSLLATVGGAHTPSAVVISLQ